MNSTALLVIVALVAVGVGLLCFCLLVALVNAVVDGLMLAAHRSTGE